MTIVRRIVLTVAVTAAIAVVPLMPAAAAQVFPDPATASADPLSFLAWWAGASIVVGSAFSAWVMHRSFRAH